MGLFEKLFSNNKKLTPILKVTIVFDEDNNVSIEFEKLHPQLQTPEYIKAVLHYYAKVLVDIDPNQIGSSEAYALLFSETNDISRADLRKDSDVLKIAKIDDVIRLSDLNAKQYRYVATLFAIGGLIRHITTELPSGGTMQHMVFSIPVLIQSVLQYLDDEEIKTLQLGLKFMNEQYRNDFDFRNLSNWESIPVNAFLAAITGYK